jgi:hypothetical protein
MEDNSYLDKKYFIDRYVYNCPFCHRGSVSYAIGGATKFDWSIDKTCYVFFVECSSCHKTSMHLSYESLVERRDITPRDLVIKSEVEDIDSKIFYSVPTSFFVIDSRIPKIIRELITESEECLKMNFLTGASACMRKAIYELLIKENAQGENYESKIKSLKSKHPSIDPELFDILSAIQDMTSDKIHEQSWDKWDSPNLKLIIETLKNILYEIYVLPKIKKEKLATIQKIRERIKKK